MSFFGSGLEEIVNSIKASCPYVWVKTFEESRLIYNIIANFEDRTKKELFVWTYTHGLTPATEAYQGVDGPPETKNLEKYLIGLRDSIKTKNEKLKSKIIFLPDPGPLLQYVTIRFLKDHYSFFKERNVTFVFVSSSVSHGPDKKAGLPPELEKEIVLHAYDLPTPTQIEQMIKNFVISLLQIAKPDSLDTEDKKKQKQEFIKSLTFSEEIYLDLTKSLQGLTENEINTTLRQCAFKLKTLDVKFLLTAKKQIISKSDILEYLSTPAEMADVGGMDLAKEFFEEYKFAHTEEAISYGVEPLKAVLLVGIPGSGKSQLSTAVSGCWSQPIVRLDLGKVMSGLVGSSEERMRTALAQVEAIAPCILQIDEIDKGLSGTKSSNFSDGGTTARVFGTLLTRMQEGLKGVTIIATANDITNFPPELIRRFDEVFFADLPESQEREQIFSIHLRKRNRLEEINLSNAVEATVGYVGAEIEKIVKRAITMSFKDSQPLTEEHLLRAVKQVKPISQTRRESITEMRKAAKDTFRFASSLAQNNPHITSLQETTNNMGLTTQGLLD